jgi:hypothetical protein
MLKSWMCDIALAVQAKSGASAALLPWAAVVALGSLSAFAFLCVAAYQWLTLRLNGIAASLIIASAFALIALIAAMICVLIRRRVRERAILARAARAHGPSWILDPQVLATGLQIGRAMGWQRLVPVLLLGFMAAQWARAPRDRVKQHF